MNSNKDLWEKNKENLNSTLKDGPPKKSMLNFTISKSYQLILGILIFLIIFGINKLKKEGKFSWKRFLSYTGIGAIFGLTWNFFMVNYDPNFPGWLYHPWSILGIDFGGMVIEDFVFYIICGAFFYLLNKFIPDFWNGKLYQKYIVLGLMIGLVVLSFHIFAIAGKSISLWFMIPAIIFYCWKINDIKLGKLFAVVGFVVLFACTWDIIVITIIPSINGYAWASSWVYISFDVNGNPHHSKAFLDYINNRWAWIGNSPVEITPYFSICGGFFCYTLTVLVDNFRKK